MFSTAGCGALAGFSMNRATIAPMMSTQIRPVLSGNPSGGMLFSGRRFLLSSLSDMRF
jgi:hypothetical protein